MTGARTSMGRHGSPSLNKLPFRQTETVTAAEGCRQQLMRCLQGHSRFQSNVAVNTLQISESVNNRGKASTACHSLSAKLYDAARR